ncbi:SSI family serine proteinase inhibitor [Streptomyces decoyicus]|uniref:SSI family serine proteinase inhibitor n=1 Tax=Streptomyces decoyicus TaxID=249567 RepID=UPI003C12C47F
MPHRRRTSSLFAAAASAAATAVTRLSATTAAAGRRSTTAAVSVVSVTAALALAAPAASAAPIPLPHHRSGNGVIGAGRHALPGHPTAVGTAPLASHPAAVGHSALAGLGAPTDPRTPTGPHALTAARTLATPHALTDHGPAAGRGAPGRDHAAVDHLTVTVRDSGSAATDGTFELYCHPGRGNHPHVKRACKKLDGMTMWGRDPFAPVPQGTNCTMMYGGPATAHVTGTWAGRPVNADFRRTNGCEISRWGRFEPLLPSTSS